MAQIVQKSCLTCYYHGAPISNFDPTKEERPCGECIKEQGFKKWKAITCPQCDGSGQDGCGGDVFECGVCLGNGIVERL